MNSYLSTLHRRSDSHKRAFALSVSGGFTLVIFSIWSFVSFGRTAAVADNTNSNNLAAVTASDVAFAGTTRVQSSPTPLEDIMAGLKSSFDLIKQNFSTLRSEITNGQQ